MENGPSRPHLRPPSCCLNGFGTLAAKFEVLVFRVIMAIKPKSMLPRISLWFSSNADVYVTLSMSSKVSFKHVDAGGEKNACAGALGSGGLIQLWLTTGGLILDLHSERGNKCTLLKPQPSICFTFALEPLGGTQTLRNLRNKESC